MKTLLEVTQLWGEQLEICAQLKSDGEKRPLSAAKKKLGFLTDVKRYLETSPSLDYCHIVLSNLREDIDALRRRCPHDLDDKNPEVKKKVKSYEAASGIAQKRKQIKFIQFIIK